MLAFYFLSDTLLYSLLVFFLLLVYFQTTYVALILSANLKKKFWSILGECTLLAYIAILATMPISALFNRRGGAIDVSNYNLALYIIAVPMILAFLALYVKKGKHYLFVVLAVFLTLPLISHAPYGTYLFCYIFFLILVTIRTVQGVLIEIYERKNNITALSIKEGLDNLPSGIMFYDTQGYIYLTNKKMRELMFSLLNFEYKNGTLFWTELSEKSIEHCTRYKVHDDLIFRCSNVAWRFSRSFFTLNNKEYIELIASDITEVDNNITTLMKDEQELILQEEQIRQLSENSIALKKEQEYARLRSQVHDVMGQRLTAIQRLLQTPEKADYSTIIPILQNMVANIKENDTSPFELSYFELKSYFERVGIIIEEQGLFPSNKEVCFLFLGIIREATTNAIRHANASVVTVTLKEKKKEWTIKITNNGKPPKKKIIEGSGLLGIRERVENFGGKIYIISEPHISIDVSVAKDNYD